MSHFSAAAPGGRDRGDRDFVPIFPQDVPRRAITPRRDGKIMKYSEARLGRIFLLRLEHGDTIPGVIEEFAREHHIKAAVVHFLGGADTGSKVIVGPEDGRAPKPRPVVAQLPGTSEAVGTGTLFLNEEGIPRLHLHAAFGCGRDTTTGCTREGVQVWQIGEGIIMELLDAKAGRKKDAATGFELLEMDEGE